MSVEKMKLVKIVGAYDKLNDAILACMDAGCFHPEAAANMLTSASGFTPVSEENPFTTRLHKIEEVFKMSGYTPQNGPPPSACGLRDVDAFIDTLGETLHTLQIECEGLRREMDDTQLQIDQLSHFCNLHIDLHDAFSAEYVHVRFGRLPHDSYARLSTYRNNPYVLFFPCSSDEAYDWGMYVAPVNQIANVDRIFASLYFERVRIPGGSGTPEEGVATLKAHNQSLKAALTEKEAKIQAYFSDHQQECNLVYFLLRRNYEAYEMRRFASRYKDFFFLVGWIDQNSEAAFTEKLSAVESLEITYDPPMENGRLKPPTKLKNKRIFRPFQYFVEIYGVPRYNEPDPTAFVAVTYTLLYGVMFADVGQGLVLALIGYLMYRFKKMPLGKILIPCGLCGALCGFVFGSVFGFETLLDPLYRTLGLAGKPIDIMQSATTLLAFSIGVGVVLILLAMCLHIYASFKKRRVADALFSHNGLAGILFYGSILLLVGRAFLELAIPIAPLVICGILLPFLLIFFHDPLASLLAGHGFKVDAAGDFVIVGFFELLEVILSYLTNTLSFLRVGAFVLIHAGMMSAFFSLAEIMGGGVMSAVMIVFGNVFVIALEGLLVGIQVLRLEFYEMFSRFYEGDGQKFEPIRLRAGSQE